MVPKEISSLQHPIVKTFVKLRTSRKFRYEQKQVVISGIKQIKEAHKVEALLITQECKPFCQAGATYVVTQAILKKISGLENPEPAVAIVAMPPQGDLRGKNWLLGLDGLNDPGNLGTLLRTALALGWEGAFLTERCVDPYNDKALRAAKGATFKLPLQTGTVRELIQLAGDFPSHTWVADREGVPIARIPSSTKGLLILGNEAQGVDPLLKNHFPQVAVPISQMESLNVAIAGSILMYELCP